MGTITVGQWGDVAVRFARMMGVNHRDGSLHHSVHYARAVATSMEDGGHFEAEWGDKPLGIEEMHPSVTHKVAGWEIVVHGVEYEHTGRVAYTLASLIAKAETANPRLVVC